MWQSLKFCLAIVGQRHFSKDVQQLLLVVVSNVSKYHFCDRFIYSDTPDCLDTRKRYLLVRGEITK